jgi:membrane protease YdiL (CAAX protease family)
MTLQLDTPGESRQAVIPYASSATRRRRFRVWPAYVFASFILVFPLGLGIAIGVMFMLGAMILGYSGEQALALFEDARVLLGLVLFQVGLNALFVLLFQLVSPWLKSFLPVIRRPRAGWPSALLLACGAIAIGQVFALVSFLLDAHSSSLQSIQKTLEESRQWPGQIYHVPLIPLLIIGVFGPISEELVFRGAIQSRLVRRHGFWPGALITSAFFGIYHFDLVQGLFAFAIGIYLSLVAYRTRSILHAIVCHMAVNTTSTILVSLELDLVGTPWAIATAIFCVAAITASTVLLMRLPLLRRA